MIDALEFKRHKAAAAIFVVLNVLGVILWAFAIALTTAFLIKTEPSQANPLINPAALRPQFYNAATQAQLAAAAAQAQAAVEQGAGFTRTLTASCLFMGYLGAGVFCIFLAHALRYLASIAEAAGKHATEYIKVVSPINAP
jgi:hypothetical protein